MSVTIYGEAGPALLSPDRCYRYKLERTWDRSRPACVFIGLNPSTADEHNLDPTLRRCVRFADGWGYGSFLMLNIFAWRSSLRTALRIVDDPVGPNNNFWIADAAHDHEYKRFIACWGTHGKYLDRGEHVRNIFREAGTLLYHLGLTKDGYPKHPLYLSSTTEPTLWVHG